MPVDLDELFTDLGRQADLIPVGGVAQARQRGDQRRRNRTVLAAAAAVLLVISGLGVAARLRTHGAEPVLPAGPGIRGLAPVGSPIKLYGPASRRMYSVSQLVGDRLVVGSGDYDGTLEVVSVDTTTGAKIWTTPQINPFLETNGPIATPRAVLIAVGPDYRVHDPATGRRLRQFRPVTDSTLIVHDDVLVEVTRTGLTRATGLLTGKALWQAEATGDDLPRLSTGMHSGTASSDTGNARAVQLSDERLAQLTVDGRLVVRDIRTGEVRTTVATSVEPTARTLLTTLGDLVLIGEKDEETGYRLTLADLRAGTARTIRDSRDHDLWYPFFCAPDRICFNDRKTGVSNRSGIGRVTAISTTDGRVLWSAPAETGRALPAARLGRVTASDGSGGPILYDADGSLLAEQKAPGSSGGWVDDDNVLSLVPDANTGGQSIRVIRAADGAVTELIALPRSHFGGCVWNPTTLACRVGVELKIWRFTR